MCVAFASHLNLPLHIHRLSLVSKSLHLLDKSASTYFNEGLHLYVCAAQNEDYMQLLQSKVDFILILQKIQLVANDLFHHEL